MRKSKVVLAACLALAGCGGSGPAPVHTGPRIGASLAAAWPVAAPARGADFSNDGRLVAMSDASGRITIRDTGTWKTVEQLQHPIGATAVAFSPDASRLFSSGYDGTVREWDLAHGKLARVLGSAQGTIWTLDISPDGTHLASGGEDTIIRVWNLSRGGPSKELKGHNRNIWAVHFSPDGRQRASGSFDASVRMWNVGSGKPVRTLSGHTQAVVGLAFSPDGRLLVSGGDDSTLRFWRVSDGAPLRTIDNGKHVDAVAFSPDGIWIASGGHAHGTLGGLWHQLGGQVDGESVRLWRAKDDALVAALPHPDDVIALAFSRDGRWLLTAGEDNRFRLWRLQPRGG